MEVGEDAVPSKGVILGSLGLTPFPALSLDCADDETAFLRFE
jgi:hypothetical protein